MSSKWTSEDFSIEARPNAWDNALNNFFGQCRLDSIAKEPFSASLEHKVSGGFGLAECICDPCGGTRTKAHVASDDRHSLVIQHVLGGQEQVTVNDERHLLGEGDVLLWDSTTPKHFDVTSRLHKLILSIPLSRLKDWRPNDWQKTPGVFVASSDAARLLISYANLIRKDFLSGKLANGAALVDSFMGLLVNVIEGRADPKSMQDFRLARAKAFICDNLSNANLSPAAVALASAVSVRKLHALFESSGTSVQNFIIRERVQSCARALRNDTMDRKSVGEIALKWGFKNVSHFNSRFKKEYGVAPSRYKISAKP